jgi:diguanylate cyclase (GGDEF)-like protein
LKNKGLKTYASLARIGFPKSYSGKIMLVVFAGTHLPLVALVLYLLLVSPGDLGTHLGVLAALLIATLLGFVATLFALRALLAPVRLASSSLEAYLDERRKPELPIGFSDEDEAGKLMADVQHAVDNLDTTIRSLEGLSGTDHLTGLPNRREGEERLGEDLARAKRGGAILTVAVVDVNNFKAINDTHGHQAGDVCLRHVALVIRRNVREGDWLARWGGDEFVLSLWDASVFASPEAVLGRISRGLKESPVRLPLGEELVLSISVGASRYAGEDDIRELLAKADAAMYEAKREGRAWVLAG